MKKAFSIILAVLTVVNMIGFGFLNVASHALGPIVIAILELAKSALIGTAAGIAAGATTEGLIAINNMSEDFNINYFLQSSTADITNGNLIEANIDGNNYVTFSVSPNVSAESAEFAQILASSLNSLDPAIRYVSPDGSMDKISANIYQTIKNQVTNDYLTYINQKALGDAFSSQWISQYEMDWMTGGIPQINLPTKSEYIESTYGGYSFSTPIMLVRDDGRFYSKDMGAQFGCSLKWVGGNDQDGWKYQWGFDQSKGAYGYGFYLIYNNKIYCCGSYTSSSVIDHEENFYSDIAFSNSKLKYFYSADGERLSDVCSNISGLEAGVYFMTEPSLPYIPSSVVSGSDLQADVGGGSFGIPLNSDEQTVAAALAIPVVSEDPVLTIGEGGNITAVDGIDINTLSDIVDKLSDNDMDFENSEEALETMAAMLQSLGTSTRDNQQILAAIKGILEAGGVDALKTVLNGIKEYEKTQTDSLSSIEENTAAIAQALAKVEEAELEQSETEFNYLDVQHTGLFEANQFVSQSEFVQQCKELLYNVLDGSKYTSSAPNFTFYYDSNGDGIKETYTAFDLSFLENTLSNENLADKTRFSHAMTIREFIQQLVIMICYVAFAIKVMKKLPGLVGGAESEVNDFITLSK